MPEQREDRPIFTVDCGRDEASGWTFYLTALARGWDVAKPNGNGYGYFFVSVYDDTDGPARAHDPAGPAIRATQALMAANREALDWQRQA